MENAFLLAFEIHRLDLLACQVWPTSEVRPDGCRALCRSVSGKLPILELLIHFLDSKPTYGYHSHEAPAVCCTKYVDFRVWQQCDMECGRSSLEECFQHSSFSLFIDLLARIFRHLGYKCVPHFCMLCFPLFGFSCIRPHSIPNIASAVTQAQPYHLVHSRVLSLFQRLLNLGTSLQILILARCHARLFSRI